MVLTPAEFVMLILGGSAALLALLKTIALLRIWIESRHQREKRVICHLCLHAFETDRHHRGTVPCPVCGAETRRGPSRRLG